MNWLIDEAEARRLLVDLVSIVYADRVESPQVAKLFPHFRTRSSPL